ncbi:hypothetical protein [Hoeflea ulvae]|uniref:Uncharacterized protein n=1 Tax=Hoeflea ulvae TaxID=2983764 RepID=A0ABT3YDK5_9HYPH|nr:hypothetical protein [Hoeflea ulvae]MCY0093968.1 hypothetical protein [Hoeflea ulvae]
MRETARTAIHVLEKQNACQIETWQAFLCRRDVLTGAWEEDPGADHLDLCHAELGGGEVQHGVELNMGPFMLHCNK